MTGQPDERNHPAETPESPDERVAERFISEPLTPVADTMDTAAMACGEPGLPARFRWHGREFAVIGQLDKWKDTGPCSHASGPDKAHAERYVRKHWFRIIAQEVETGETCEMKVYCERQARSRRESKRRWWIYTITA